MRTKGAIGKRTKKYECKICGGEYDCHSGVRDVRNGRCVEHEGVKVDHSNRERNDRLLKDYNDGKEMAEILEKYGISRARVYQILKREENRK